MYEIDMKKKCGRHSFQFSKSVHHAVEEKQWDGYHQAGKMKYFISLPQMRSSHHDVIQCVNVEVKEPIDTEEVQLVPKRFPTIIFESMGVDEEAMRNVYRETKKYQGNTICVFGLNKRVADLHNQDSQLPKPGDISEEPHHLRNFSFVWKKPERMEEDKGYAMPFIEARKAVMEQAQSMEIIHDNAEESGDGMPQNDYSHTYLYRWIDGDAKDDSSVNMDKKFLRDFARSGEKKIATGTYRWRHQQDETAGSKPTYHKFINLLNRKEALLRNYYFSLMKHEQEDGAGTNAVDPAYRYLRPGKYYLPESVFLMNQAAHDAILEGNLITDYRAEQSRESEKIFARAHLEERNIVYRTDLHVTKPLKREFEETGYAQSLMEFFKKESYTRQDLEKALKIRQSAFDNNWGPAPVGSNFDAEGHRIKSKFAEKQQQCIDRIDKYLKFTNESSKTNFKIIKEELGI